jgi:phosphoribosylformimino-5-aminoimidazole carboxamide ribotide isomerase
VGFDILPAIDLREGRVARMRGGDPGSVSYSADDPVEVAHRLVAAGARWLHVVDLDAAVDGEPGRANARALERIAALPVRVQAGGGLSPSAGTEALRRGADRAVVSAAFVGAGGGDGGEAVLQAIRAAPGRIAIGLDVRGESLSPRGGRWPDHPLRPVVDWIAAADPRPAAAVVTQVERDGSLAGVDVPWLVGMAARLRLPVVASGGVASLDDLIALAGASPAIAGAIVGRAFADGVLTLQDALQAVAGADD